MKNCGAYLSNMSNGIIRQMRSGNTMDELLKSVDLNEE